MFVLCADHGYFGASNLPHLPWVIMAKLWRPATTAWNLLGYRTKLKVYGWKKDQISPAIKSTQYITSLPKVSTYDSPVNPITKIRPERTSSRRGDPASVGHGPPSVSNNVCIIYIYYVYIYMILYYIWYCIWYCIWYYILGMGTMMCIYIIIYVCIYHVMISCHMLKGRPVKSSGICLTWGVEVETHHS